MHDYDYDDGDRVRRIEYGGEIEHGSPRASFSASVHELSHVPDEASSIPVVVVVVVH